MSVTARVPALQPFRIRSFRFQWPADLLASWAFEMEGIILGWYVLVESRSVLMLTIYASMAYVGTLLGPMLGVMGDRIGQRNLLSLMRAFYGLLDDRRAAGRTIFFSSHVLSEVERVCDRVAIVDSATATASALVEILEMNGLEAPGTSRGTAADPGSGGHARPAETFASPTHLQLTTGDVDRFRETAGRLFGETFLDVAAVELAAVAP